MALVEISNIGYKIEDIQIQMIITFGTVKSTDTFFALK